MPSAAKHLACRVTKVLVMLSAAKGLVIDTIRGHGAISDGAQLLRHVELALSVRSFALLRMTRP
jgi:hypothetical protein